MLNQHRSLNRLFRALENPGRRRIVERLSRGPASVQELARPLDMSLPGVLQHLQVLERSGVVKSRKEGRVRTCHLNPSAFERAEDWISRRKAEWEQRLDRLGAYLAMQTGGKEA